MAHPPFVVGVGFGLAAAVGVITAVVQLTWSWVLICAITVVLTFPLAVKLVRGTLDLLEPLVTANVALGAMFVLRPALDIAMGSFVHIGYDVRSTFDQTLAVALLGVAALQIGYAISWGGRITKSLPKPARELEPGSAIRVAIVAVLIGYVLYGTFVVQTGGLSTIATLLGGRGPAVAALQSTGYLYQGLLLVSSASLVLFALALKRARALFAVIALIVAIPELILQFAQGERLSLMLVIGSATILWFLVHDRRPRFPTVVAAAAVLLLAISYIAQVRNAGSDLRSQGIAGFMSVVTDPVNQVLGTLEYDNDMFDSLANELTVVPSRVPFLPGSTFSDLVVRAIPRPVWPDKPLERNDAVVVALWPAHYAVQRASPAFSILGSLYADSGLIGVLVGMLAVGVAARAIWTYFVLHRDRFTAQLLYATALPLTVTLLRGTLPDTLSRALFLIAPILLCDLLARRRNSIEFGPPV